MLSAIAPHSSYPLHSAAATRAIEQAAASALAPHTLMQRAGLAVARLACAVAPHAQTIWVACGPGNNGGDGLEAAMHLARWGHRPVLTLLGSPAQLPPDAAASLARALQAGVQLASAPPARCDLAIDALLGLGTDKGVNQAASQAHRPLPSAMQSLLLHMHTHAKSVLCVDLPSGLSADTGCYGDTQFATQLIAARAAFPWVRSLFCLNLLTLKPGCFTAQGKDAAGQVWFDDLGLGLGLGAASSSAPTSPTSPTSPTAWLLGADRAALAPRLHASHKGSYGDVAVVGGAPGMLGAALLAARAALHAGAGRVLVSLLDGPPGTPTDHASMAVDPTQPELMFRPLAAIDLRNTSVVCGCGGGTSVRGVLAQVLSTAQNLVLDADALNAIAIDTALQTLLTARTGRVARDPKAAPNATASATVITPHPLEAARLLGCSVAQVQTNRLHAAQQIADRFQCTVILKSAGSIIAAPGELPRINHSGNAALATAGTGDVLAGVVGAYLAAGMGSLHAACAAAFAHGQAADRWPASAPALTASGLAVRCGAA